ncbi:hypothetical protein [Butyrivibrio sp. NC3005]|uniref:hypothetical protein n=1 Tax=Butyrivibrio sp. NC3005 TaxID=1280685 RepID=UPI0004001155|nr:hypothetical protein [Butyrivibrio sp. NC3005]
MAEEKMFNETLFDDNVDVKSSEDMDFDDLEAMFGENESDIARMEKVVLSQNLEGFANCFPEWDLHPPVR